MEVVGSLYIAVPSDQMQGISISFKPSKEMGEGRDEIGEIECLDDIVQRHHLKRWQSCHMKGSRLSAPRPKRHARFIGELTCEDLSLQEVIA